MNCNPAPEVTCGTLVNDSCVIITGTVPACLQIQGANCYRQSELNAQMSNLICSLNTTVTGIVASIGDLSTLTGCTNVTPSGTTVHAEFQAIYNAICALQTNLNLPLSGIDVKCLVDPCGTPIATLGQLLQALVDAECDAVGTAGVYRALISQTDTDPPVATVLENSIGAIVWTRSAQGVYLGTLAFAFPPTKTFLLMQPPYNVTFGGNCPHSMKITNSSQVTIRTSDTSFAAQDDVLDYTSIEIRVYA